MFATSDALLIDALLTGGDSRIALDPRSGLNRYRVSPVPPSVETVTFASCTASPIGRDAYAAVEEAFSQVTAASGPERVEAVAAAAAAIEARIIDHFGLHDLASAVVHASGTDAMLSAALLIAAERPGVAMTAILPSFAETGSGVPVAVLGRDFDGPLDARVVHTVESVRTIEIALRSAAGVPLAQDDVDAAFARAAAAADDRSIVYVTHSSKTGLIAPLELPAMDDVVVDACQCRIEAATLRDYLERGWLVAVTGSKFFGGPAFSGALLVPHARHVGAAVEQIRARNAPGLLGTVLRWTAAFATIDRFPRDPAVLRSRMIRRRDAIARGLAALDGVVPVVGLQTTGEGWSDVSSIATFAVRKRGESERLCSMTEVRPVYELLANSGYLLGQPVGIGEYGGLRIASGLRDLLDDDPEAGLSSLFAALGEATAL